MGDLFLVFLGLLFINGLAYIRLRFYTGMSNIEILIGCIGMDIGLIIAYFRDFDSLSLVVLIVIGISSLILYDIYKKKRKGQ